MIYKRSKHKTLPLSLNKNPYIKKIPKHSLDRQYTNKMKKPQASVMISNSPYEWNYSTIYAFDKTIHPLKRYSCLFIPSHEYY